ncbi:hypothetical protein D7D52_14430 [Nocardia yunnanensis]|uniref:Uncharacterized protein n=1 Tax=Nocardia yunnanensis TaxID=2382165 RepID=A0A386ZAJ4_9NOCA|nr:hypothetical protein [Nocardia yunnanensis]AYF74862.1 hypothetical protein D7D52_14430 [Nocardia yunnanensis]
MTEGITAALRDLSAAFAPYPRRPILDRCPHCGPPVQVADADLFWLSIKLGNTVGDSADVKALLPLLLEHLATTNELDPTIVLGKLTQWDWRSWPPVEQAAIDRYLNQIWLALLSQSPSRIGAFADPAAFLEALSAVNVPLEPFLSRWDSMQDKEADHSLAKFIVSLPVQPCSPELQAWIARKDVQDSLLRAFERHHTDPQQADTFANAYDIATAFVTATPEPKWVPPTDR